MTAHQPIVDAPIPVERLCPSSIMPGQHCGRPVAEGETLCANHLAMGTPE